MQDAYLEGSGEVAYDKRVGRRRQGRMHPSQLWRNLGKNGTIIDSTLGTTFRLLRWCPFVCCSFHSSKWGGQVPS